MASISCKFQSSNEEESGAYPTITAMLDVEMEEALASAGPSSSRTGQHSQLHQRVEQTLPTGSTDRQIYLVLDTNVLITSLDLVQKVYTRLKGCPRLPIPGPTKKQAKLTDACTDDGKGCLLVPYVVLDGKLRY
jgi:hypothetical protein